MNIDPWMHEQTQRIIDTAIEVAHHSSESQKFEEAATLLQIAYGAVMGSYMSLSTEEEEKVDGHDEDPASDLRP